MSYTPPPHPTPSLRERALHEALPQKEGSVLPSPLRERVAVAKPSRGEGAARALSHPETHITLARNLRSQQTDAEQKLWLALRNRRLNDAKFRRQQPVGKYVADFLCLDARLIIELDGSQHQEQIISDAERTEYLNSAGFKVLRFWNNEVLTNLEGVLTHISEYLLAPSPHPLPQGEGFYESYP